MSHHIEAGVRRKKKKKSSKEEETLRLQDDFTLVLKFGQKTNGFQSTGPELLV